MLRFSLRWGKSRSPGIEYSFVRAMATKWLDYTSLYDVLDVHPECTKTEIREAWLKLSMLYHPDLNKDNEEATKKFMEVKEAYKILVNDEARQAYNDKIGFHHSDPPPDYRREWTLKGEKERIRARAYSKMWSEEQVRKLMGSANLRDINWDKTPPSERYRILMEEEKKQRVVLDELDAVDTPSIKAGRERYLLIVFIILLLCLIVKIAEKDNWHEIRKPSLAGVSDVETEDGLISKINRKEQRPFYPGVYDEKNNAKYWVTPGVLESNFHHNQKSFEERKKENLL